MLKQITILFLLPAILFAQQKDTTAIHYSKSISKVDLEDYLRIIASDDFQGRETGMEGQKIAAEFISSKFQSFGIPPYKDTTYYQTFPINVVLPEQTNLMTDSKTNIPISTSENVLAYIEGSDLKDELIIISAHYDHLGTIGDVIYKGADDDGSGTVAVMELAKVFATAKKEGHGSRRSILCMTVSGEEKGLLGSSYYVKHPEFPLVNTVCDLNIDMIGRIDEKHVNNANYVYLIGSDKLSSQLHAISENANKTYSNLELDYTYNDEKDKNRFYYRSDHYNFAKNGIPVVFYFNGIHADYHKPTDNIEKINFDKIEKITKLVFFTAWELANRNERIVVDTNKK